MKAAASRVLRPLAPCCFLFKSFAVSSSIIFCERSINFFDSAISSREWLMSEYVKERMGLKFVWAIIGYTHTGV
jgi:hypothetical protein